MNLTRCRIQQIGTAHDMTDPLSCIVDDDRQLISVITVGALEYEIADILGQILADCALDRVLEHDFGRIHPYAPRPRRFSVSQSATTSARIYRSFDSL